MATHEDVLIALRRIVRATDRYSRRLSKEAGLTAPQLLVMQSIAREDELTMGQVAEAVSLSQATVTTILDRLEARGLVKRKRGEQDKRRVYAYLTTVGKELLLKAPTPLQVEFVERFNRLEHWEQLQILSSLQRVAKMMKAEEIDASPVLDLGAMDRSQPVEALNTGSDTKVPSITHHQPK